MGKFTYQSGPRIDIEDRTLAHLQVVIANKLRRNESFIFSWREDVRAGGGRTSVWLDASIPMTFKYFGSSRPPAFNRAWLEALAHTANLPAGLHLVPEPADEPAAVRGEEFG